MALKLDLQDHEKAQWPPLHALKRVGGRTLVILVKSNGAGGGAEKLSKEELGTVEEEDSHAPEGLPF